MSARAAARLENMGFTQVYRYTAGKADWLAAGLPGEGEAAEIVTAASAAYRDVNTARPDEKLSEIRQRMRGAEEDCAVVVNDQGVVLGFLGHDALNGEPSMTAEQAMASGPLTVRANIPLEHIRRKMADAGRDRVLVTDPDGRLIGLLRRDAQ